MGLKEYIEAQENPESYQGLFLETAHPIKFLDAIKKVLKTDIEIPQRLKGILDRKKLSIPISEYEELKFYLLSR